MSPPSRPSAPSYDASYARRRLPKKWQSKQAPYDHEQFIAGREACHIGAYIHGESLRNRLASVSALLAKGMTGAPRRDLSKLVK
jgi:hypothetical protein